MRARRAEGATHRGRAVRAAWMAAVLVTASAAAARAQAEPELRSYRHMAVGGVAFLTGWEPAIHAGYLAQLSLAPSRTGTDEFGATLVVPPVWFAHLLIAGGYGFDTDGRGDGGATGLGQLGLVRRLKRDGPLTLGRVGVAAQGSLAPDGYGAVARFGLLSGNAAVSVGWMRFPDLDDRDRLVVSVDLLRCILQDLGLVSACAVP